MQYQCNTKLGPQICYKSSLVIIEIFCTYETFIHKQVQTRCIHKCNMKYKIFLTNSSWILIFFIISMIIADPFRLLYKIEIFLYQYLFVFPSFLDAIASPSSYPCQSVSQWVIHSFRFGDSYRISELCELVTLILMSVEVQVPRWRCALCIVHVHVQCQRWASCFLLLVIVAWYFVPERADSTYSGQKAFVVEDIHVPQTFESS